MKITIIGTGYVGLVTGTCLSDFGLEVTCVDQDKEKISLLNAGKVPIYEQNLEDLIIKNVSSGRLSFSMDIAKAIKEAEVIFIAVGTPPTHDGSADLTQIENVAVQIASCLNGYKVIVNKSTVPVGTAALIIEMIKNNQPGKKSFNFDVVSNPEFLREGSAIHDFTHPDKIVIGTESERALKIMEEIYRPLYLRDTPFVMTNLETAEMIKYACNSFLATKISFINEIANLCDKVGADVHQIARAMGLDGRISSKFLHPGPGYGGSCFPKDTRALCCIAKNYGYEFKSLDAVVSVNERQRQLMVEKIQRLIGELRGKQIGILGLAFKQNTDDIRESSSIDIIKKLLKENAKIKCFDPLAMENVQKILPDILYCENEYDVAKGCDCLVIATEWNQFRNLDLEKIKKLLKNPIFIDLRNLYEPEKVKELGFTYEGVGRK